MAKPQLLHQELSKSCHDRLSFNRPVIQSRSALDWVAALGNGCRRLAFGKEIFWSFVFLSGVKILWKVTLLFSEVVFWKNLLFLWQELEALAFKSVSYSPDLGRVAYPTGSRGPQSCQPLILLSLAGHPLILPFTSGDKRFALALTWVRNFWYLGLLLPLAALSPQYKGIWHLGSCHVPTGMFHLGTGQ